MAVVRANYLKSNPQNQTRLRGSVRYYATREGLEREGFSRDQDALSKEQVNEALEQGKSDYYYRFTLNPGMGDQEQTDLKEWTRDVMGSLAEKQGEVTWYAFEHTQQGEHDHVHVVALMDTKLSKDDLETLRETATERWHYHQAQGQELTQERLEPTQAEQDRGRAWSR